MTTALVTGGAGFIGSNLCDRLLAEGKRVVAIDDLSTGRIGNLVEARAYGQQFTFYNVDIRADGLPTIFERHQPEVVFHLAARPEPDSVTDPPTDASVSVMGLLNVLECARGVGRPEARVRVVGVGLRRHAEAAGPRDEHPGVAAADAGRRGAKAGRGLPALLPALPGHRVHRAGARQRVRARAR